MSVSKRNPLSAFIACAALAANAQTPGDGSPLKAVHPGYSISSLMPTGLALGVSGLDFMADGRLVVSTWGGDHKVLVPPSRKGEVYVLSNVAQEDSSKVTYKKFMTGLQEPLGLKVVNDTIYLSERQALSALADKNGNGAIDSGEYRKLVSYAGGGARHEFFFGLVYKDGWFYGMHSLSLQSGASVVPQPSADRGTFVRIEKATGKSEVISGGARESFGMGMNPDGEIFSTEVQGSWNPACGFNQVKPGRFYGHPLVSQVPASPWDTKPYQKVAVLLPQSEIANAPGEPVYVPSGTYKGHYLYGDVTYGGIQRVFLEKIGEEYQGAVMRFSAGFNCGVSRLKFAPNGDLIVGQIGDGDGNWNEPGKKLFGLQKLKANGKSAFEMLTVRSRPKGMELEFTEQVAADANLAAKYEVKTWTYTRTSSYGGSKVNPRTLTVTSVQVDPITKKKVYLEIAGLTAGEHVVHIRLRGLKSATDAAPWTTEAWYTLNAFGTGDPFSPPTSLAPAAPAASRFAMDRGADAITFRIEAAGAYELRVTDARGVEVARFNGMGAEARRLPLSGLMPGAYVATLREGAAVRTRAFTAW